MAPFPFGNTHYHQGHQLIRLLSFNQMEILQDANGRTSPDGHAQNGREIFTPVSCVGRIVSLPKNPSLFVYKGLRTITRSR